jgi:NitT/TauT family transport system permease protein
VHGARETTVPLAALDTKPLSLDPANLPEYALRTTLRIYAPLAAKSRRAEIVLIPILDILQSVPILGFLTFTVVFFMGLFPGEVLGAELASVVRHFHQPSLEHDLQHVPVAAQPAAGP